MSSILNVSREERAYHVLKLCELAARGLVPDIQDVDDDSMELLIGSYNALTSKLKYLIPRASAAWSPEFDRVLSSSHSMPVQKINVDRKEARRGFIGTCMACGRTERNCRYSIDLAGEFDAVRWLSNPLNVHDEYEKFTDDYEKVYGNDFLDNLTTGSDLPSIDKGTYIVGETCLRKAKLRYMLQTFLMEACYTCERDIEEMMNKKDGSGKEDMWKNDSTATLFTIDDAKCENFVKLQDQLELAIADEKRALPELVIDGDFWDVIDEARALVSGDDEDTFNSIIRQRAADVMQKYTTLREQEREEEDDDAQFSSTEQDHEEEDDPGDVFTRRSKRRRTCVVGHDESDDDDGTSQAKNCGRREGLRSASRGGLREGLRSGTREGLRSGTREGLRGGSCDVTPSSRGGLENARDAGDARDEADEEAEEAEEDGRAARGTENARAVTGSGDAEEDPAPHSRPISRRERPASISGIVGMQRATGSLPSRRDVVLQLMGLQMRLQREERSVDSALCTNAILTLQELLHRVDQLSHTV